MGSAEIEGGGGRIRCQLGRALVEMGLGLIAAFVRASDAAVANVVPAGGHRPLLLIGLP